MLLIWKEMGPSTTKKGAKSNDKKKEAKRCVDELSAMMAMFTNVIQATCDEDDPDDCAKTMHVIKKFMTHADNIVECIAFDEEKEIQQRRKIGFLAEW